MRLLLGTKYDDMHRSLRISNRRFKAVSNWNPLVPNARLGWAGVMREGSKGNKMKEGR